MNRFIDIPAELTNSFRESVAQEGTGRTWTSALRDSLAHPGQTPFDDKKRMDRVGIVELQAGGWSFTARDMLGGVWVGGEFNFCAAGRHDDQSQTGQLDGTAMRLRAADWSDECCQCPEPTRIPLPCKAESISAGRRHLLVLDSDNLIWEFTSWGRVSSPHCT